MSWPPPVPAQGCGVETQPCPRGLWVIRHRCDWVTEAALGAWGALTGTGLSGVSESLHSGLTSYWGVSVYFHLHFLPPLLLQWRAGVSQRPVAVGRLLGRSDVGSIQIQGGGRSAGAPGHTEASLAGALAHFSSHKLRSVSGGTLDTGPCGSRPSVIGPRTPRLPAS